MTLCPCISFTRVLLASLVLLNNVISTSLKDSVEEIIPFNWEKTKYLIAFGDSYTFIQGTNGYPGFSFIGDYRSPENLAFTPQELLTTQINQNYYGTSAGGPNWVEFLSGCSLENGLWFPSQCQVQLWDFAFAGADYSAAFLPVHADFVTPMVNQMMQYLSYAEPVIREHMDKSRALIAIWIGINDVGDAANVVANQTDINDIEARYDAIVSAMFNESVSWLHDAGYRDFLFVNVPPRDRAPGRRSTDLPTAAMIESWNSALNRHHAQFSASHPTSNSFVYDSYAFLNHVLDNYSDYGFENASDFCANYTNATALTNPEALGCRPLNTYFWFNSGHIELQVAPTTSYFLSSFTSNLIDTSGITTIATIATSSISTTIEATTLSSATDISPVHKTFAIQNLARDRELLLSYVSLPLVFGEFPSASLNDNTTLFTLDDEGRLTHVLTGLFAYGNKLMGLNFGGDEVPIGNVAGDVCKCSIDLTSQLTCTCGVQKLTKFCLSPLFLPFLFPCDESDIVPIWPEVTLYAFPTARILPSTSLATTSAPVASSTPPPPIPVGAEPMQLFVGQNVQVVIIDHVPYLFDNSNLIFDRSYTNFAWQYGEGAWYVVSTREVAAYDPSRNESLQEIMFRNPEEIQTLGLRVSVCEDSMVGFECNGRGFCVDQDKRLYLCQYDDPRVVQVSQSFPD
ncbi:hypothetical protein PFICI_08502 [Pestalotiopsis fici W106-1]|uniref:SGNH hydrolase-type esterase domain-containing protein n=1 Tax=Pestalotiopsis fici (strain W106-1 / CGMCC3.15140) TaxID=1229662 RepID=W3WXX7_PESFW|nr:uncharacterized protein PFICI_08502 [Pestalotiopsis fici W106-1]ETS78649.1 hypothetical protein PFICI_08502 [Pestalotiopsis fici W106-1]